MAVSVERTSDSFSKAVPSERLYEEMIRSAAAYNKKIGHETKMRLPFIDSQTGVAQRHTDLFKPYISRQPGIRNGQLYSYPAKRWKKKKSSTTYNDVQVAKTEEVGEIGLTKDMHQITAVENPVTRSEETQKIVQHYQYYYEEWENVSEPLDAGEIEHRESDSSDFEDSYTKKKRKKPKPRGATSGRGKKKEPKEKKEPTQNFDSKTSYDEEQEKPFSCDRKEGAPANGKYCDFCLGNAATNKKTGQSEELVSCADCGRSGHPSCLQFTANMIISVKKYPWQCIECKSCGLCGTSENDDQLLFCDDCDRGFHMYCLKPPLSKPPEGNWSCHLCIVEFYGGKKRDGTA